MSFFKTLFGSKTTTVADVKHETQPELTTKEAAEKYVQQFTKEPYNFQTITLDALLKRDKALYEIYTNEADGFLIKNFLTESEVNTVMSNFDKVLNDNPAYTAVGFTYPTVFAEFSNRIKNDSEEAKKESIKKYFEKTKVFKDDFAKNFGVDLKAKFENLFKAISGGREVLVAEGMGGAGNYPFSTFRYLTPEKGLMSVHCGNYFGQTFERFYEDLTKKVAVENQMSFFIMLQEPDAGGELSLFNFRWKKGQTKDSPSEDNEIIQPDGSRMDVNNNSNITKDKIDPKKGDMILFQGGNIWHKVETIQGQKPRITFGGFIGISVNKDKFYYWS